MIQNLGNRMEKIQETMNNIKLGLVSAEILF